MATTKAFRVKTGLTVEGAELRPAAGTTSYPPILLTSGTNLTTATPGAFEYDGTNFYLTAATGGRKTIAFSDLAVSQATASTLGTIKLSSDTAQTVAINAVSATASRSYGLQVNASGQGMVNVPWTDTVYTLPTATATALGGIELFSATAQSVAANAVTTTASRTYGLQLNSDLQGVVNVPWTDTNTFPTTWTYTDGTTAGPTASITGTSSTISVGAIPAASGTVSGVVTTGAQTFAGVKTLTSPAITTSLTTGSTSFDLVNTTATTVNFAGAGTAVSIGAATGNTTVNNSLIVTGNLTVNGTTNTINSTTITVDDKNLELGSVASPTNTTADGGGITLKGATDKTFNWISTTGAWTSSEDLNLLTGKVYEINGTTVLSATALGSSVVGSSLTSVGTIGTGVWQGTLVAGQYGGTGVNNSGKTITLGGNLTTSGAFNTTFTVTNTTNVTLPTSGTLMTTTGNTTGSAATLTTTRTIWGQDFNGSANVTGNLTSVGSITGTLGTNMNIFGASTSAALTGTDGLTISTGNAMDGGTGGLMIKTGNAGNGGAGGINIEIGSSSEAGISGSLALGGGDRPVEITNGMLKIGNSEVRAGGGTATSGTVSVPIFATATYQAAKVLVKMKTSTAVQVIEMLVAVNAAGTVYMTQYGDVQSNSSLGTVDASIASGIVSVDVAVGATSTTVSVSSTAI